MNNVFQFLTMRCFNDVSKIAKHRANDVYRPPLGSTRLLYIHNIKLKLYAKRVDSRWFLGKKNWRRKKSFFAQNLFWFLLNFWQNMSSSRSRLLAINYICIQQQRPVVRYRKCYTTCNPYKSFMASGQILASTFSYKCVIKFNNKITSFLRYSLYQIYKVGKENLK